MTADTVSPPGADHAELPPPPQYRGLKTSVVVMGVLLIVGFIVVFSTIIYRAVNPPPPGSGAGASSRAGFGDLEAILPPGGRIGDMILDGDRLAVRVDGPLGSEILVFDVRRGRQLGRIQLRPEGQQPSK